MVSTSWPIERSASTTGRGKFSLEYKRATNQLRFLQFDAKSPLGASARRPTCLQDLQRAKWDTLSKDQPHLYQGAAPVRGATPGFECARCRVRPHTHRRDSQSQEMRRRCRAPPIAATVLFQRESVW